ncbi:MAG TPA: DUF637 domain-containing protein, partial [Methylibium sp.]|uniref:DUF637 domain-containing protein n=1 Tax=Methylibium sp. TaxID=2067992 RepID=UPI002DBC275D
MTFNASSTRRGFVGQNGNVAIGVVRSEDTGLRQTTTQVQSQVASLEGNVSLQAGERYTQQASSVLAAGDIDITARSVDIAAGLDTAASTQIHDTSRTTRGGTVNVSIVEAVRAARNNREAADASSDSRLQTLAAMNSAVQITNAAANKAAGGMTYGARVGVALGQRQSHSKTTQSGTQSLQAGRDLVLSTGTSTATNAQGTRTSVNRPASLYVGGGASSSSAGTLIASAARDLVLEAAAVTNASPSGVTALAAGRDLRLGTVTETREHTVTWDANNTRREAATTEVGSRIDASGDLQLIAARDLALRAAGIAASGDVTARASGNLTIAAGEATRSLDEAHRRTERDTLRARRTTTTTRDTVEESTAAASTVQGRSVTVVAGNDLRVQGSVVQSDTSTVLAAGNNLAITSAQTSRSASHDRQETTTGLLVSATRVEHRARENAASQDSATTEQASRITSGGDVSLLAGNQALVHASELRAGRDLGVQGAEVILEGGLDAQAHAQQASTRRSGGDVSPHRPGEGIDSRGRLGQDEAQTTLVATTLSGQNITVRATGSDGHNGRIALAGTRLQLTGAQPGVLSLDAGTQGTIDFNLAETTDSRSTSRGQSDLAYQRAHEQGQQVQTARYNEINLGAGRLELNGQVNLQIARSEADARTLERAPRAAQAAAVAEAAAREAETRAATSEARAAADRQAAGVRSEGAPLPSEQQAAVDRQAATDRRALATQAADEARRAQAAARAVPTLQHTAQTLAMQPGLGYLATLVNDARLQDPAAWQAVETATRQWDHSSQGLTPAGAVIVAAVVTYFTAGAASSVGTAMVNSAAGAGAAATTAGTAAATAAAAAMTTLASQAAISVVNNQGNLARTLDDLGSRENVRALIVSMLGAGIASGLTDALNLPRGQQLAGASFGTQFQSYAVQTLSAAGVNAVVNGTSFETAARNALVTALGQTLTTQIGDVAQANGLPSGDVIKVLAHAGVQCAEAQLTRRDCASAAIGAATAELLAPLT